MHRRAVSVAPQLSPAIAAAAAARTRRRLDCAPKPEAVAVAVGMVQCSGCSGCSTRCSGAGVSPSPSMGWDGCVIERTAVLSNANSVYLPPGNSNLTQLSSPAAAACALSLSLHIFPSACFLTRLSFAAPTPIVTVQCTFEHRIGRPGTPLPSPPHPHQPDARHQT
jgi:hypothetical protein